ncbi:hypothetical protein [Streptosporangium sp. H16]|uniref:hypothetical protein n=1 Tax=Streptosporangium sp. H16 TaxID=3444184 RepID=UPI003F79BD5F
MTERLIEPCGRGFLLFDSHPGGCDKFVDDMWNRVATATPDTTAGHRPVALVIGSSAGYGMATTIAGIRRCGNDSPRPNAEDSGIEELWREGFDEHRARFASYMRRVRQAWPEQVTVAAFMQQRTAELNATHPPALHLGGLLTATYEHHSTIGPRISDTLGLGVMSTCEWIDPAAVAEVGYRRWNDFASHRPGTVPAMLGALLNPSVDEALRIWALDEEPIRVMRIAGFAGPLYTLGENGAHRLTAARLADLPGIWASVEQAALPLQVRPYQVVDGPDAAKLLACWRGLLARGLVTGHLEEDPDLPAFSTLHLDDAAAMWLLAGPRTAIGWAAAYEGAYPGALADLGIAPERYADVPAWTTWLSSPPLDRPPAAGR